MIMCILCTSTKIGTESSTHFVFMRFFSFISAPEREKTVPPDPLDEDYVPVPSFASAFSEAFSSAMETQGAATSGGANQKGKGKKQKGKKLLFTTSNGPKYS